MARRPTEQDEIRRLIAASAAARGELGDRIQRIRRRLDLPSRALGSVRHRAKTWLFGSMAAGFLTSMLLRKRRKKGAKGLRGKLLALTLTAARPVLKMWLTGQARKWTKNLVTARLFPRSNHVGSPFQIEPESPDQLPRQSH